MADILIVEDNPVNQKFIAILLQRTGYSYEIAENGKSALSKLETTPFRLVLMDMMMPVMNGYDATRSIRGNPKTAGLPVIALTANAMKGEDEKCRRGGMRRLCRQALLQGPDPLRRGAAHRQATHAAQAS